MRPNHATFFQPNDPNHNAIPAKTEHASGVNPENQIIVRVWLPKIQGKSASQWHAIAKAGLNASSANVGHVSLETPDEYVSLWPDTENMSSAFKRYRNTFNSLKQDEFDESGPCDLLVCFYSLNIPAVERAFDEVKPTSNGYVLAGDFSLAEAGGHSCCSIVYGLLKAGGIERYHPERGSSMASGLITPTELADFVREAKVLEVIAHPETVEFERLKGEYFPERNQKCTIL